jgi:hypothetical protein
MGLFDSFQARVGRQQGAQRLFVAQGGFFNVGDVQGGANGVDIPGISFKAIALNGTVTRYNYISAALAASYLSVGYGTAILSVNASANFSINLPYAYQYAMLLVNVGAVQSDGQIKAGSNTLVGMRGSALSFLSFTNGSANQGWVQLAAIADGSWAVSSSSAKANMQEVPAS